MTRTHIPVLAGELIELLDPQAGEVAIDCTFGGGGHARLVAERIGPAGTLIGIDRDPAAEERFAELSAELPCQIRFIRADFVTGLEQLREERVSADLVYLDLGMSSLQVDTWQRGFSYTYDAPLDMRMDPDQAVTAQEIINTWDERRLARLLREYGEERYARQIARAIVRERRSGGIAPPRQLVATIKSAVPAPAQFAAGHPARRTFQALRIAVNDELGALSDFLGSLPRLLRKGGRAAAISFHSLEDRLVKQEFARLATGCICPPQLPVCACGRTAQWKVLTRKAVQAGEDEVRQNPRARSARLRAVERLS